MKYFFLALAAAVVMVVCIAGFRGDKSRRPPIEVFPDMDRQAKIKPQSPSVFFADGRGARMPVPGTVPAGVAVDDEYPETGMIGQCWGDGIPVKVTLEVVRRGQERYAINCQVCHGATGKGNGIVSQYGVVGIANLQQPNYLKMADGEIFNTITKGKGQMNGYGADIAPEDRWAIVAYLRVLQRSQNATINDVPESERPALAAP
jgi:mono/diheme cytochrome c family protein